MRYTCTCGRTDTDERPQDARYKCPFCRTFPMEDGHRYHENGEGRCWDCDTRDYSHRKFPGDWDYASRVEHAAAVAG